MAKAKKLPSGSWRCLIYDFTDEKGKRHYKSFTSSDPSPKGKREVEKMAAVYAAEKEEKKKDKIDYGTFQTALSNYIREKEQILSPSTIRCYRHSEKTLLKDYISFCDTPLIRISVNQIQALVNDFGITRSPKTVRNMHGLITAVLYKYRPDFIIRIDLPKKVRPDIYIPTDDNIRALMDAVDGTELEIPVMLAAFGTMRRGEVCGLDISDIQGNIAHIHQNIVIDYDRNYVKKAPKTFSSDRYVELPQFVIDKIKQKGYITRLMPEQLTRRFEKTLINNNIPHFRFHDLRHYSASIQHALGVPDAYIMQRGGWSSDTVLKSVYRHALDDKQKQMNNITNNYFNEKYATRNATRIIKSTE